MSKRGRDDNGLAGLASTTDVAKVIYYGSAGAFADQAATQFFANSKYSSVKTQPSASLDELFGAVASGSCQYGARPLATRARAVATPALAPQPWCRSRTASPACSRMCC